MKVLHIISSGGLFGAEGVVLSLCSELKKKEIECLIVNINTSDKTSKIVSKALELGLNSFDLSCKGKLDFKAIKELRKLILSQSIDIVHSHGYKSDFFSFFALLGLKTKLISTNHNWTSDTSAVKIYEFIDALLFNFFDKIIGVSEIVSSKVKQKIFSKNKTVTIYNGININLFSKSKQESLSSLKDELNIKPQMHVIGVVGRIVKIKGYSFLLEAGKKLIEKNKNIIILFVGDGPLREDLKQKAINLSIDNNVIFAGIQNDMNIVYDLIDIFVISSVDEGLPLVLLEAMAKEKPIVSTNVGAIPSVITNNINGLLIPSRNVNALTDAITELINDKNKAKYLGIEAAKTVREKFSSEVMTDKYIDVYKNLLT